MQQHGMAVDVEGQASLEAKLDDEPDLLPDELEVLGVTVRPTDSLKTLREACVLAGIGKSGRKAMFTVGCTITRSAMTSNSAT